MKYLIFGGTGSLGYALNRKILQNPDPTVKNTIVNFSRDEAKHWKMKLDFQSDNRQHFEIGDCSDASAVERCLLRHDPNIVIIAQAMKHIDLCERNITSCFNNNFIGTKNILDAIEKRPGSVETVIFVSSDKACSPINSYGMCKALSENLMVEREINSNIRYINVRYGNVLDSKGSILQILDNVGKDPRKTHFSLTDPNMTRFVMTMSQAVDLVMYAIRSGSPGQTIVSGLQSMRVVDLIDLFSVTYGKPVMVTGLRSGEKLDECLINGEQCRRTIVTKHGNTTYYRVFSHHHASKGDMLTPDTFVSGSECNLMSKWDLWNLLKTVCPHYVLSEPKL